MKRLLILLCGSLLLLSACGAKASYTNTLPCADLADTLEEQIPANLGYETYGADHIQFYFKNNDLYDDLCLRYTARSEDIGEFGILHATDPKACRELEALCREYLETLREEKSAFIASYAPEELPKLEQAEVRAFGSYVTYAILSEEERELFFDTVEKRLTEK